MMTQFLDSLGIEYAAILLIISVGIFVAIFICRKRRKDKLIHQKYKEIGKAFCIGKIAPSLLHQMSQPVTAICGFAQFTKEEMHESDPFYKPISLIEEQAISLKRKIEIFKELVYYKDIHKEDVDVNIVLKEAVDLLKDELKVKRTNWHWNLQENLPSVYADKIYLKYIFIQLITDAMEASNNLFEGFDRDIEITSRSDEHKKEVEILFEQTNAELLPEDDNRIPNLCRFAKGENEGMFLDLCKDIIKEHNGEIKMEYQKGKRVNIIMRLPCKKGKEIGQSVSH